MTFTLIYTSNGREYSTRVDRKQRLTWRGFERVLRRTHPNAILVRVESATL